MHCPRPFEKTALSKPRVRLKVFVDDLQLDQEDSETDILRNFPKAAAAVPRMLKEELKADVVEDKAALVANNQKLAEKLRAAIGDSTGRPAQVAKNLGIDTSSGRSRRTWARKTTRRLRLCKAAKAALRLKVLRRAAPTKTKRMIKTNLMPKSVYGVQVGGLGKIDLMKLQRMAAAQLPPFGGGKSRRKTLLLHGDPTAAAATAATARRAKEVWHSANAQRAGPLRLTELQVIWNINEANIVRPTWATSKGPVSVMHLELARIGWTMSSFNAITDREGARIFYH